MPTNIQRADFFACLFFMGVTNMFFKLIEYEKYYAIHIIYRFPYFD